MPSFYVKTSGSFDYNFEAHHFEIHNDIIYFYKKNGDPVWVIKDWLSFKVRPDENDDDEDDESEKPKTPDDFYSSLKDEK